MFPCKLKLRSPLHHIVFALLLLVESSFIAPVNGTVAPIPIVQLNTTQANCLSCTGDKVNVSSQPQAQNLSTSSTGITLTPAKASEGENKSSTALPFTVQAAPADHAPAPPTAPSQPPAFNSSDSSAPPAGPAAGTGAAKLNATTVKPVVANGNRTTAQVTAGSGAAAASTTDGTPAHLPQTATKPLCDANTSTASAITTTTAKTTQVPTAGSAASATESTAPPSPPPPPPSPSATSQPIASTRLPFSSALPANNSPPARTVPGAAPVPATTTSHNALVRLQTTAAMVEVLGGALSRQLANTAFLLAVLVCGSLLFLITVLVFVKQAYESYNRKDYSQVDYLINGMYSDSSV